MVVWGISAVLTLHAFFGFLAGTVALAVVMVGIKVRVPHYWSRSLGVSEVLLNLFNAFPNRFSCFNQIAYTRFAHSLGVMHVVKEILGRRYREPAYWRSVGIRWWSVVLSIAIAILTLDASILGEVAFNRGKGKNELERVVRSLTKAYVLVLLSVHDKNVKTHRKTLTGDILSNAAFLMNVITNFVSDTSHILNWYQVCVIDTVFFKIPNALSSSDSSSLYIMVYYITIMVSKSCLLYTSPSPRD